MNASRERRSELRLDEQATIFVELLTQDADEDVDPTVVICNSLDISANGVQVTLDQPVSVGSVLRLGIEMGRTSDTLYLVGEAKWVRLENDEYHVGFALYDAANTDIASWKQLIATMLGSDQLDD